jgi:hypothetical protein
MLLIIIVIVIVFFMFIKRKERFTVEEDDMFKDRFIGNRKRYINQIDWYRNAPNIDLEREFTRYDNISPDDVDWSKVDDYTYGKLINNLQGKYDSVKIKSINAI